MVFQTREEEAKYKAAKAKIEGMALTEVQSTLASYKNSENTEIKMIIYELNHYFEYLNSEIVLSVKHLC